MEKVARCRQMAISALCTRAWGHLYFCCVLPLSLLEGCPRASLCGFQGVILTWLLLCECFFQLSDAGSAGCWHWRLHSYGVGWSCCRPCFLETHKEKSTFLLRGHLATFSRNGSPQFGAACQQSVPMAYCIHGQAPKAKSSKLIQLNERPWGCFQAVSISKYCRETPRSSSYPLQL